MKKKILASLLALVLVLGMLPMSALADVTVTAAELSMRPIGPETRDGVTIAEFDYPAAYAAAGVTFANNVIKVNTAQLLKFCDDEADASAQEGTYGYYRYHLMGHGYPKNTQVLIGIAYKTPAGAKKYASFQEENEAKSSSGTTAKKLTESKLYYNDEYLIAYYKVAQFDSEGNVTLASSGSLDQDYMVYYGDDDQIVAVTKVNLSLEAKEPMSMSDAGVEKITETADITGNNTSDIKIKVTPDTELDWVEKKAGFRDEDGWWIGLKAIAPTSVTNDNVSSAKYRNNGDNANKSFGTNKDGTVSSGQYYIELWGGITEKNLNNLTAAGKTLYTYTWYFNWDGDENTGTTIKAEEFNVAEGKTATDMKGVDQIITLTFDLAEIKGLKKDNKVVWKYEPKVEVTPQDGTATVTSAAALGAIAAVSGDEQVGGNNTATISADFSSSNDGKAKVEVPADVFATANIIANGKEAEGDNEAVEPVTADLKLAIDATGVGSVTLDADAIKKISSGAGSTEDAKVTISIEDVTSEAVDAEQPAAGDPKTVVEVKVEAAGTSLLPPESAEENGEIAITIPAPEGATKAKSGVWYGTLNNGKFTPLVKMFTDIIEKNGKSFFSFTTNHLSAYATYLDDSNISAPVPTVIEAPIAHHPTADTEVKGEQLGSVKCSAFKPVDGKDNTYSLTLTGTDIVAHKNANQAEGYWVGFGMSIDNDTGAGYSYKYKKGDGELQPIESVAGRVYTPEDSTQSYNTIYFDEAGTYTVTQTKDGFTATYIVTVKIGKAKPEGVTVVPAPLADHPTGSDTAKTDLGTVTVDIAATATDKVYDVTVTGDNIVSHNNAQNTPGTWVGFGMPIDNATGDGYSYQYKKGSDELADVETVAGRVISEGSGANIKYYNTIYFDEAGTYTVVQKKDGTPATTVTYVVTVVINEKIEPVKVVPAPLADHSAEAKTDLGTITISDVVGTKTADGNTYTFTLTGNNIVKHENAQNIVGPWVGFGMPIENSGTYTYFNRTNNANASLASAPGRIIEDDEGGKYNTVYFNEAGTYTIEQKKDDTTVAFYVVTVVINEKSSSSSSGGGGGGGGSSATVSVPSASGGKVSVSDRNAKKGDTVTITTTPNTGKKVDTVTVTDAKGNKIAVTDAGNGKYTFVMPDGKVTVKVTFTDDPAAGKTVFSDVPAGAYYADAVAWAVEMGITNGTGANTFSPEAPCTRAQIVTFLWRAAGSPKASGSNPFTDVKETDYFYDAVLWAVEMGITNGTGADTFSPANTCTRGQTVTFLYRYAGQPAAAGSNPFVDVAAGEYYTSAVLWAVEKGITNGTGADTFSPANTCTRGQIVTFLYRDLAE